MARNMSSNSDPDEGALGDPAPPQAGDAGGRGPLLASGGLGASDDVLTPEGEYEAVGCTLCHRALYKKDANSSGRCPDCAGKHADGQEN